MGPAPDGVPAPFPVPEPMAAVEPAPDMPGDDILADPAPAGPEGEPAVGPAPAAPVFGPEALGLEPEGADGDNEILLLTLSALLEQPDGDRALRDPSEMSREEVRDAVLDALAHPVLLARLMQVLVIHLGQFAEAWRVS